MNKLIYLQIRKMKELQFTLTQKSQKKYNLLHHKLDCCSKSPL